MFIQNVSKQNIVMGFHFDAGINSMLIQIVDPGFEFPVPKYEFKEIHKFQFLDVEDETNVGWEFKPTIEDAKKLVSLLVHAKQNRMNVIVHCHAGLCRSGAVCEVGTIIGFTDTETKRIPNTLVKKLMMRELGLNYDSTQDQIEQYKAVLEN